MDDDEEAAMSRQRYAEKPRSRPPADARERQLARNSRQRIEGGHLMPSTTRARLRAAIVVIAPTWLLAALFYHPYIADLTDNAAVAAALTSDTTRWGLSHLAVGIGFGLAVLAFLAIRSWLHEAGEERWSILAFPFIIMGSTLFTFLPAMEIGTLAAAEVGADAQAVQTALDQWFFPVSLTGAVIFGLGVIGFAMGIARSGILGPRLTWLVVGGLVVMAVARFVPSGAALYVGGVSAILALWPLAYEMLKYPEWARGAEQPRAMPAV